jgi:hypothetical protein
MTNTNVSTIICEVVDRDGIAWWKSPAAVSYQMCEPWSFPAEQPAEIPVDLDHDGTPIGRVAYLESGFPDYGGTGGGLYAVAVVDRSWPMLQDLQASAELISPAMFTAERASYRLDGQVRTGGNATSLDTTLRSIGLVRRTASVTAAKVKAWPGDLLRDVLAWSDAVARQPRPPAILTRARAAEPTLSQRSWRTPTVIHRPGGNREHEQRRAAAAGPRGRMMRLDDGSYAELEYRPGGPILSVS